MREESEHYEQWPVFDGTEAHLLKLVRTIAAMANTEGGAIHVPRVAGDPADLSAARLIQAVNRHVAPRVKGIETSQRSDGSVLIHVDESFTKPHVFTNEATESDGARPLFSAGQIWVRRGSADCPAGGEDVVRLVREAASRFLERLSIGIRDPAFSFELTDAGGVPVHLAEDEESVPVSPNLARLYPYTTKSLAQELGRPTNWVATAAKVLRLKDSRDNAYGVPSPSGGRIVQWRYSAHALKEIRRTLEGDPQWNPYHQ